MLSGRFQRLAEAFFSSAITGGGLLGDSFALFLTEDASLGCWLTVTMMTRCDTIKTTRTCHVRVFVLYFSCAFYGPCSNTYRRARLATHQCTRLHPACGPCSHAQVGRSNTACMSSQNRLGSLHRFTHATGHGNVFGVSTSTRILLKDTFHHKSRDQNMEIASSLRQHIMCGGQRVFYAPCGGTVCIPYSRIIFSIGTI